MAEITPVPTDISGSLDSSLLAWVQTSLYWVRWPKRLTCLLLSVCLNLSAPAFCHLYSSSEAAPLPCLSWLFSDDQLCFFRCFCCTDSHYSRQQPFEHPRLSVHGRTPLSWSAGVSTKDEMGAHYAEISVVLLLCPFSFSPSTIYCYSPYIWVLGRDVVFPVALSKVQVRHTQAWAPSYVQEPVRLINSCENELNGFQGHLISENCFCAA